MELLQTIASILRDIGYHKMASDVLKEQDESTIQTYVKFILIKMPSNKKHAIQEQLWAEGLLYG